MSTFYKYLHIWQSFSRLSIMSCISTSRWKNGWLTFTP